MTASKRQAVAIHGGDPYRPRDEFVAELKAETPDPSDFKLDTERGWKDRLQEDLGGSYEVFNPKMPTKDNARYSDWKVWFEKLVPFLSDGVVLIGHSLGGIFLAKYLSENRFPKKIGAVMLVAAPYHNALTDEDRFGGFGFGKLALLAAQSDAIFIYHSKDDPVVDFDHAKLFLKELPGAALREFSDRAHLWQERFPEILRDIRNLR